MFMQCPASDKSKLLDFAKAAREERALDRKREFAAIKIQALVRKFLARCKLNKLIRHEIDLLLQIPSDVEVEYKPNLKPALEVFHSIQKFFLVFNITLDCQRFDFLCRYVLHSLNSDTLNKNVYVSVMFSKDHVSTWISQLRELLSKSSEYLQILNPDRVGDSRMIVTMLHFQVTFTNTSTWKFLTDSKNGEMLKPGIEQLCKNCMGHLTLHGLYSSLRTVLIKGLCKSKPNLKSTMLAAIFNMSIRPLVASDFSDTLFTSFLLEILSVPAVIHHINVLSIESLVLLMTHRIFSRSLDVLMNEQSSKIIFNVLEGNYALCLLANLIQLGNAEKEGLVESTQNFMSVATKLLEQCKQYVKSKKSNLTHWHPVLGWFAQKTDTSLNDAMPLVVQQLSGLWNMKMINLLFEPLFSFSSAVEPVHHHHHHHHINHLNSNSKESHPDKTNFLKKALEKFSHPTNSQGRMKVDPGILHDTCSACGVYMTALQSLSQLKMTIMAGLCFQDILLPRLWMLMNHLGPQCGLKTFLETMSSRGIHHPLFNLLQLSCDTAKHVITILDDVEMYEQEHPFPLQMLVSISSFLKDFVYKSIWSGYIDITTASTNQVFLSTSSLLQMLHSRDCRRSFTPEGHWLIKEIKSNNFMSELNHNKPIPTFLLQKMSHIIPHKERISLFRKYVSHDKDSLGISSSTHTSSRSTIITVHRSRLIEDGYRQLVTLSPASLKGLVRVKFINEQGLDEAGIDQDGVFKEFLEETIKRVFDPSLNLFKATCEQKLYPSPTSHLQDNHLALFEFVGRILGKAVYEGIVVDVPFASFFLSQLLGHTHSVTYSSIDELPSLDPELYKSLTYIKHYKGDIGDLDLTFSYNEDVMGKVVTHELVPGGRVTPVTNENKISYLHLMAHFKMRVIIKDQSNAFIRGFKSIISSDWLEMFSGPELQKLISGDTNDIDLDDLRKHTHYYGGFHNNHRVIDWLWDILKKDFTPNERRLFLKFVTSCSKGPLLGFAHLEPPFSIRCVEVSEDQDSGDTVGSVLKGFFNIRKKDPVGRLPTSSTCFNLLKLPNYQKKNTLRDKLRYSITSNTGFELS